MIEKIIWVNPRSNRIDPMEGLVLHSSFQSQMDMTLQKGEGICSRLQSMRDEASFFSPQNCILYVQPEIFHALTGQKQTNTIMAPNLTLDPWQVATLYALYLQLIFSVWPLLLLPGQQAVNATLPVENDQQAFHQSTGKLCLKRLYTCLNRHDPYSWNAFFTATSALQSE